VRERDGRNGRKEIVSERVRQSVRLRRMAEWEFKFLMNYQCGAAMRGGAMRRDLIA
jgi:hypothetical protein